MNIKTYETLNFIKVKDKIKEHCVSGLGKALLDNIKPVYDKGIIVHRLRETTEARNLIDNGYNLPLKGISDITNILDKVEKDYTLDIEELLKISDFLRGCKNLKRFFQNKEGYAPNLTAYSINITEMQEVEFEINNSIKNNTITSDATKELKNIRRHIEICEGKIKEKLEKFLKNSTNKEYLQDAIIVQRNNKYCIPIKANYKNFVDGTMVDQSATGSTIFIEPNSVKKSTSELEVMKIEEQMEVYKVLAMLTNVVYLRLFELKTNVDLIAKYDMIFAKGKYSANHNGIEPKTNELGYINIIDGIHPMIDNFEPLNFVIGEKYRALVITGPNAGGKTVVLKTVGILTMMTQAGFHIEAKEGTNIGIFNNIFVDIGDNQSIENSLSTFSSHMENISEIIKGTNKRTLILLDEIGSGTEPNEGAGLGIAVLEHLYKKGAIILATTHYGEIKSYSEQHIDFENAAMEYKQDTLEPMFRLHIGSIGNSNAFYIAEKMGIPKEVRQKALLYIETKNYDISKLSESFILKEKDTKIVDEKKETYQKGDRVKLLEKQEIAIIYKPMDQENNLTVFYNKEFIKINYRRVELVAKASELYPQDYDLETLFTEYKERKLEHDIERGSKKALKKLHKNK